MGLKEEKEHVWRDASPDQERAVRFECVKLVMGSLPLEPTDDVVTRATVLSNFILGLAKAEKIG